MGTKNERFLASIKTYLQRRRLGELLLVNGLISPQQLKAALKLQKQTHKPLGQIFLESAVISKRELRFILFKQAMLRVCATLILGLASVGGPTLKKAQADPLDQDTAKLVLASASREFARVASYPALVGMGEKRSTNLKPFTKWTGMLARFESQLRGNNATIRAMEAHLETFRGGSIKQMADNVNDMMNAKPYILDKRNWGANDYWETPAEFMQRGGDCEDYAIAKYAALRALGVPEERLRIAIVQDTLKNIAHAVLVVYAETGAYMLDNQNDGLLNAETYTRYRPIYSINREAWWLHSPSSDTRVASAR
jgi:predicted transglutaminase-like cysteine proteinase